MMRKILIFVFVLLAHAEAYAQPFFLNAQVIWNTGSRTDGSINLNNPGLVCTPDCMQLTDISDSTFLAIPTEAPLPDAKFAMRSVTYKASPCTCGVSSIRCEGLYKDTTKNKRFTSAKYYYRKYPAQPVPNSNSIVTQDKTNSDNYPVFSIWMEPFAGHLEWVAHRVVDETRTNNALASQDTFQLGPVLYNTMTKFTKESNWTWHSNGYHDIYMNDVLVRHIPGPTMNLPYDTLHIGYDDNRQGIYDFGLCPNSPSDNTEERDVYILHWLVGGTGTTKYDYMPSLATTAPTAITTSATNISYNSATLNGNITSAGTTAITERGFVYGPVINPTIADNKIVVSGTTGFFTYDFLGLTPSSVYHVRAYATNSIGTSYGLDTFFFTTAAPAPGSFKIKNPKFVNQ